MPATQRIRVLPIAVRPDGRRDERESGMAPFYPQGCLMAHARAFRGGALVEAFELGRVTPMYRSRALAALDAELSPDPAVLLFSSYVWNHAANLEIARAAKQRSSGSLVVFGGPHVPRRADDVTAFFAAHPWIDVAARGEGEITLSELLAAIAEGGELARVAGISFRDARGALRQTGDRARTKELGDFPSPYLGGEFAHWVDGLEYAMVETNRGCPYGCTFCDWGAATLAKIHTFSDERVFGEIEYLARNRVHGVVICDANFGILPRDLAIAEHIVAMHERHGFPRDVAYTNAKNANSRLQQIVKRLRDAGLTKAGQISMQTIDDRVLDITKRTNIRTSEYERIIRFFHSEGVPATSDMMIGLPGQTYETTRRDLQFFFDHMVTTTIHATTVMPNAPMADPAYRERYRIEIDDEFFVESTFSFDKAEYQRILALCYAYKFFVKVGVARYLLYFLQRERGLPALDFIDAWLARDGADHPLSQRVKEQLLSTGGYSATQRHWLIVAWADGRAGFLFDDLGAFLRELVAFCAAEFGVDAAGPDLESVLAMQQSVMPNKARRLPLSVPLAHDVVGWFSGLRRRGGIMPSTDEVPPLLGHGPGVLELADQPACTSYEHADADPVIGGFELRSNLTC